MFFVEQSLIKHDDDFLIWSEDKMINCLKWNYHPRPRPMITPCFPKTAGPQMDLHW